MYSDEPEAGPSRKRKRSDTTASPRHPKRIAADTDSSSSTETDIDEEDYRWNSDDDQPLQYIDLAPPESAPGSTSTSTPSLSLSSLPHSQTHSPSPHPPLSPPLSHIGSSSHRAPLTTTASMASTASTIAATPKTSAPDFLSEYTCPICFSPPTNATLTPCGHICCGACLFTAVKTTLHRGAVALGREPNVARCPVCRAPIPGWDGRGGGVIGLKARVVISL